MKTRTITVDPRKLRLLEQNARYMRHETFKRLVENIKTDGDLTSSPFCAILDYLADGDPIPRHPDGTPVLEVLSGNHRVQAAIAAGLTSIEIKVPDPLETPIPKSRRIAIQLSHNSLTGEDDPASLKSLFEAIDDVDLKQYAGLDDKTLKLMEDVKPVSFSEANLQFQQLTLIFLPDELERAQELIDAAQKLAKKSDATWLARLAEYDRWLDAVEAASASSGVKNVATAMMAVLSLFERHITELSKAWEEPPAKKGRRWVPLATIFGVETTWKAANPDHSWNGRSTLMWSVAEAMGEFLGTAAPNPKLAYTRGAGWTNELIINAVVGVAGVNAKDPTTFEPVSEKYGVKCRTFAEAFKACARAYDGAGHRDWRDFDIATLRECHPAFRALQLPFWVEQMIEEQALVEAYESCAAAVEAAEAAPVDDDPTCPHCGGYDECACCGCGISAEGDAVLCNAHRRAFDADDIAFDF